MQDFRGDIMARLWKSLVLAAAVVMTPLLGSLGALAASEAAPPPVSAKAVELIDGHSGRVLYAKNSRERLPMASVTKLMTLYLAVKAIQEKKIARSELVPVSEEAYRTNGSQIWLEPGERLSVDHLLKGVAIGSANDAAYALGEYIAGSEDSFVADMNRTARQLGMTSTHFSNAHGLHARDHYTSAHDLGLLALHAVKQPLLLHYTGMREDRTIRNGKGGTLWLINHNRLLGQYPGMDGLKTGFTSQAGFCMVATAQRLHTRMIAVVLGAPSSKARFQDAAALLTWGFQNYQSVKLAGRGDKVQDVTVRRGAVKRVAAVFAHDQYLTVSSQSGSLKRTISVKADVEAPVRKGQVLGEMVVSQQGAIAARVPIVAERSISRTTWLGGAWKLFWKIAG